MVQIDFVYRIHPSMNYSISQHALSERQCTPSLLQGWPIRTRVLHSPITLTEPNPTCFCFISSLTDHKFSGRMQCSDCALSLLFPSGFACLLATWQAWTRGNFLNKLRLKWTKSALSPVSSSLNLHIFMQTHTIIRRTPHRQAPAGRWIQDQDLLANQWAKSTQQDNSSDSVTCNHCVKTI